MRRHFDGVGLARELIAAGAIGEILGMVLGAGLGWHTHVTVAVSIGLAFFFGYALAGPVMTVLGMRRRRGKRATGVPPQ